MNPLKTVLTATTALVASSSLSFATLVTQTAAFSASTNWGTSSTAPGFTPTDTLSLAGFNTSLGTLNSVTVVITETAVGTVNLTNNGSSVATVTANLTNTLDYILPSNPGHVYSFLVQSNQFSELLQGKATSGSQPVSGSSFTTRSGSNLAVYESPWTAYIGDIGQVTTGSSNSNGSATYTDLGGVTLVAEYFYTPAPVTTPSVPEPASLAVFGTALVGAGVLRRRKKST